MQIYRVNDMVPALKRSLSKTQLKEWLNNEIFELLI